MGTLTTTVRLSKPTIGGDVGPIWPNELNSDMDYIDQAINQTVNVAVADTNAILVADGGSGDQARYAVYNITGAWTANRTITLPANVKIGACINSTTGGKNAILSAGAATLTVPAAAGRMRFEVDGSNNVTSPLLTTGAFVSASSGYTTLPGGIILQWGTSVTNGAGANAAVTFPVAFSTAGYQVLATIQSGASGFGIVVGGLITTSFSCNTFLTSTGSNVGPVAFNWMAIGQ